MALAEDLRDAGYSVVEASNADEAMDYLNTGSQIDLVFSDIRMPGSMDGLELARRLRVERPALPVILASGGTERIATFVAKPYRMEQVLSVISKNIAARVSPQPPPCILLVECDIIVRILWRNICVIAAIACSKRLT